MKKLTLLSLLTACLSFAYPSKTAYISIDKLKDGIHHWNLEHPVRDYARLDTNDVTSIADKLLAWQNKDGGWPKNIDWLGILNVDSTRNKLDEHYKESTLDNRNTWTQITYLSYAYTQTHKKGYKTSAEKGLKYLLSIQNKSGGWRGWDVDAITFNDEVMQGVLNLFLDIVQNNPNYKWVNQNLRHEISASLDKGIKVTLACQIIVNGKKTAWCQQHDHVTLKPVKARTFELPSITANESCDILLLLMRIQNPSPEIRDAVNSGIQWLKTSKINGIKTSKVSIPADKIINKEYPYDLIVETDSTAPGLWARFYEIETNKPFMCTRQGVKVYKLADVDPERRTGYDWYGRWPEKVFPVYENWSKTWNK